MKARETLTYRVGDRLVLDGESVTIEQVSDGYHYLVRNDSGRRWHVVEPFLRKYGRAVAEKQDAA